MAKAESAEDKAWVISVDMGYGHQRAAYPLRNLAYERIITANSDKIVLEDERKQWNKFQFIYESVSRLHSLPLIGKVLWGAMEDIQSISPYYPFRDLSKPNLGSLYMHRLIRKNFLRSLVEYTKTKKLPFVTTFFAPALAAAHAGMKDIYCIVTDTDLNRVWVPEHPKKEVIYYLTPTERASQRLKEYGVPPEHIFFTGFPLPEENLGDDLEVLSADVDARLRNLDPKQTFHARYRGLLRKEMGAYYGLGVSHPLTLTYAVGGAGAQRDIGASLLRSLKERIRRHQIRVNIVVGTHLEQRRYFLDLIKALGLEKEVGAYATVLCTLDKKSYFEEFNALLHTTDILWTKPSELSFYAALGLPIIIAPPLGAHEHINKAWLVKNDWGIEQEDPRYADEWIFEWLDKGILAQAAWRGFTEAPKYGTENIRNIIFSKDKHKVELKY